VKSGALLRQGTRPPSLRGGIDYRLRLTAVHTAPPPRLRSARAWVPRFVNPITRRFAGLLPGFAILTHIGRRSGRPFSTPINVFKRGDHYVFALTYGPDVDWVKNVLAAGECEIRTRGRAVHLVEPELITDPDLRLLPWPVRLFLIHVDRVTQVIRMRATGPGAPRQRRMSLAQQ
jgi:deazaflavin-dependent oxidoreductase (nitroreductase family)